MNVIIKDIQKLVPDMKQVYLHMYAKSTGNYELRNGWLHTVFTTDSIRNGMLEKLDRTNKAIRLSAKHREQSRSMINKVLEALDKIEGKENEKA